MKHTPPFDPHHEAFLRSLYLRAPEQSHKLRNGILLLLVSTAVLVPALAAILFRMFIQP